MPWQEKEKNCSMSRIKRYCKNQHGCIVNLVELANTVLKFLVKKRLFTDAIATWSLFNCIKDVAVTHFFIIYVANVLPPLYSDLKIYVNQLDVVSFVLCQIVVLSKKTSSVLFNTYS